MKKLLLLPLFLALLFIAYTNADYNQELKDAYTWAFSNSITTQSTIEKANMNGEVTRIALSKMISNYAIKVLNKKGDTSKNCNFTDITSDLNKQYDNGVTNACQLGLMGQGITRFRPYDSVTRAEFGTILSRLLYGNKYDGGIPYYEKHLKQLNKSGIIKNITEPQKRKESRGNVMIMLQRTEDKNTNNSNKTDDNNNINNNTGSTIETGSTINTGNTTNTGYYNGNNSIPSFDELDQKTTISCLYEDWYGDTGYTFLTKKQFILPYKDGYFSYSYYGQDGLGLSISYRKNNDPCNAYISSDDIGWWPGRTDYEENETNKIYFTDYTKELNCKDGDPKGCEIEAEKYAYNLLIGKETNEYFSLRMDYLKKRIDNNDVKYDEEAYNYIDRSKKYYSCIDTYKEKYNIDQKIGEDATYDEKQQASKQGGCKYEKISNYCKYEYINACKNTKKCDNLESEIKSCDDIKYKTEPVYDDRFPGYNVIYGGTGRAEYNIVSGKTIYYNEALGISVKLGEELSGGLIEEEYRETARRPRRMVFFMKKEKNGRSEYFGMEGYNESAYIKVFDNGNDYAGDYDGATDVVGKNNKFYFVEGKYNEKNIYSDLNIFDVK